MRAARRFACPPLFLIAALLAGNAPAHAAWPNAPTLNRAVCTFTSSQFDPQIAPDGRGGAYVVWEDNRFGAGRIHAQHVLASGVVNPLWPANGLQVSSTSTQQINPRVIADGSGGAIVSWEEVRTGSWDVFAKRLIATGPDPAWPAAGVTVCNEPSSQNYHGIVSDGAGGAILAWMDWRNFATTSHDIYAQRVLASGTVDPAWPFNGRAIVTATGSQGVVSTSLPVTMVPDGAGGVLLFWNDLRNGATHDIYGHHVHGNGALDGVWPLNGQAICTAAGDQYFQVAVEDGAGGAILAWQDLRAVGHIYAQHVTTFGFLAAGWPVNGLDVNTGVAYQESPTMVSDGSGGGFVIWSDSRNGASDLYAHHLTPSGIDAGWPADGASVVQQPGFQYAGGGAPDGAGGALVWWHDTRTGAYDLYAHHLLPNATPDPRWPVGGRAVCTAPGNQYATPALISDEAGGLIMVWHDQRTGDYDIYAQRVARHGYLGTPEAEIASVRDVPNDQGGKVKLSWYASYLDTGNDPNLAYYEIYRSVPPNEAQQAYTRGARRLESFAQAPEAGTQAIVAPSDLNGPYFWELIQSTNALHYIPTYSYIASTASDSTGAFNPLTAFMIVGRSWDGSYYWLSRPDSGYSADNLPPATPAPFTGEYQSGSTALHWDPNAEPDFAHYRLYRGSTAGFVPGPGNLVASPPDTGFTDAAGAPYFYKLSAVDDHGNESGFALLMPSGTVGTGDGALPREVALAAAWPNPARTSATFRAAVPSAGHATLAIYDAGGRRVRELFGGALPAGEHARSWDLRDESGHRVAPGLYFAALDAGGGRITRRFTVMR